MNGKLLPVFLTISCVTQGLDFEGKIHEIIDKIHPSELLADLKQNVNNIVEEFYVKIDDKNLQKCQYFIDLEIKNIDKFGAAGFEKCRSKIEGIEEDLMRKITHIKDIGQVMISSKPIEKSKCSYFHFCSDSSDAMVCLKRLVATPVDAVLIDINKALAKIQKLQENTFQIVLDCVSQLQEDLIEQEIIILKNYRHCLRS